MRRSKSRGFCSQAATLSLDGSPSSRTELSETTTTGVSRHCGKWPGLPQDRGGAVTVRKSSADQNGVVLRHRRARGTVTRRTGEIGRESGLTQPPAQRHGGVDIVTAEQDARGRRLRVEIHHHADARIPERQRHVEYGSATWRIGEAHFTTEPVDNLLDDTEPESSAAWPACVGGIGLCEPFENA